MSELVGPAVNGPDEHDESLLTPMEMINLRAGDNDGVVQAYVADEYGMEIATEYLEKQREWFEETVKEWRQDIL